MDVSGTLRELLGESPRLDTPGELAEAWAELEGELKVEVPGDVKEFLDAYGSLEIWDFLRIHAPGALAEAHNYFGLTIAGNDRVVEPLLPEAGGMLLWGTTVEADLLFLVQRPGGWRVAAWVRQWREWYESDLPLAEWMASALSPEGPVDWLPEWEYPLEVEVVG